MTKLIEAVNTKQFKAFNKTLYADINTSKKLHKGGSQDVLGLDKLTIVVQTPNATEIKEPYNLTTIYGPVDTDEYKKDNRTIVLE